MINRHQYISDTLYLYFDYNYEFGSFDIKKTTKGYINEIKDYIKRIKYKGSKIVIMVGSIAVATLTLNNNSIELNKFEPKLPSEFNNLVEPQAEYTLDDLEDYIVVDPIIEENTNESAEIKNTEHNEKEATEKSNSIIEKEVTQKSDSINEKKEETFKLDNNTNIKSKIEEESSTMIKEEIKKENIIKVIHNGITLEMELEDYVVGVVAAEMPASFNIEALKAQSIIARTYAFNITNKGRILTDNESTQSYIDENQMKTKWGSDYNKYYNKIVEAVNYTKGITIKYNGEYIDCVYHSTSNGYTEDAINVWGNDIPYLKSVESSWDRSATTYLKDVTMDLNTFNNKLGTNISSIDEIEIIERNSSERVSNIKVGDKFFTGINFRTILNLRSSDFDIEINDNYIKIITRGYGHGVGMSQYGANGMANSGYNYMQILNHYYTNVIIN